MSNSSMVTFTKLSPHKTSPRNHKIDTITIHCFVGQVTAEQGCNWFAKQSAQSSANYVVGFDGSIGLSVDEKDRSWCSSSASNDHRAVTIEVACEPKHPYTVTDKAFNALIRLVADICERNGIKKLLWKNDKSLIGQVDEQNMTVHRWFWNKECPGEYLMNKHPEIAEKVNAILTEHSKPEPTPEAHRTFPTVPFAVKVLVDDLPIHDNHSLSSPSKGFTGKGVFTIVEVNGGFGRLKSGAGWIDINTTFVEVKPIVTKKSNDEIAREVLMGLWGNGSVRKQRLTEEGYDYNTIQKLVNKMCS